MSDNNNRPAITNSRVPPKFAWGMEPRFAAIEKRIRRDERYTTAEAAYVEVRGEYLAALLATPVDLRRLDSAASQIAIAYGRAAAAASEAGAAIWRQQLQQRAEVLFEQAIAEVREQAREEMRASAPTPIEVRLEIPPIRLEPIDINLALPELAFKVQTDTSNGVTLEYDADGRVVGTRPRLK